MLFKTSAELVYVNRYKLENGSPAQRTIETTVKVDLANNFSDNFYLERGRTMRNSLSLIVNAYHTDDISDNDGNNYYLAYVNYNGSRYAVENILYYNHNVYKRLLDLKKVI